MIVDAHQHLGTADYAWLRDPTFVHPRETLHDARDVEQAVDLAVRRDDLVGKLLDRRAIGDVQDVGRQVPVGRGGEGGGLGEDAVAEVHRGNPSAVAQQRQHHLAPDAVAGAGDDENLVRDLHPVLPVHAPGPVPARSAESGQVAARLVAR